MEPTYVCQDCDAVRTPEELDMISRYGMTRIICKNGCLPTPEGLGVVYEGRTLSSHVERSEIVVERLVMTVAILFAREDSIYKTLPGCDVYDQQRDARTFAGGMPVVAHPPCRAWGRLRQFAKPRSDEKDLALWAIDQVQRWGGVLEHPESSTLWKTAGLPLGNTIDQHGGYTLQVEQFWWGHRARKRTWLYVCGIPRERVPAMPLVFGEPTHTISRSPGRKRKPGREYKPTTTKAEREHSPIDFARWLVKLAQLSQQS